MKRKFQGKEFKRQPAFQMLAGLAPELMATQMSFLDLDSLAKLCKAVDPLCQRDEHIQRAVKDQFLDALSRRRYYELKGACKNPVFREICRDEKIQHFLSVPELLFPNAHAQTEDPVKVGIEFAQWLHSSFHRQKRVFDVLRRLSSGGYNRNAPNFVMTRDLASSVPFLSQVGTLLRRQGSAVYLDDLLKEPEYLQALQSLLDHYRTL